MSAQLDKKIMFSNYYKWWNFRIAQYAREIYDENAYNIDL